MVCGEEEVKVARSTALSETSPIGNRAAPGRYWRRLAMRCTRYTDEYVHLTEPSGRPSTPLSPALVVRSPDAFEDIQPILPQRRPLGIGVKRF